MLMYKVDKEFTAYIDAMKQKSAEELIKNAGEIAGVKLMYDAVKSGYVITNYEINHFLSLEKPLQTLFAHNDFELDMYDDIARIATMITDEGISDYEEIEDEKAVKALYQKIKQGFNQYEIGLKQPESLMQASAIKEAAYNVLYLDFEFDEYDAEVLLQFKEPMLVVADMTQNPEGSWNDKFKRMMNKLNTSDILELPYELDESRIMDETKYRHQAIADIAKIVPITKQSETLKWLDIFREMYADKPKEERIGNPYGQLVDNLKTIQQKHTISIAQDIYDIGVMQCLTEEETLCAAEHLALGEDYNAVFVRAENREFDYSLIYGSEQKDGMDLC